jgi:hypothetical protein
MKDNNVYISKNLIEDITLNELDFDLQNEFGFDYDEQDEFIEIIPIDSKRGYAADAEPIAIERLIGILVGLKNKNCTHVQIETHHDHHGYDILGYNISKSTKLDIIEYKNNIDNNLIKQSKIMEL